MDVLGTWWLQQHFNLFGPLTAGDYCSVLDESGAAAFGQSNARIADGNNEPEAESINSPTQYYPG